MERTLLIQPRDPVIFRDGKPFTEGLPSRSIDWPLPSALIGAIRTRLGRFTDYKRETIERLQQVEHTGPFLAARKGGELTLAFPAPADALAFPAPPDAEERRRIEICPLRPERLRAGEGMDLPKDPKRGAKYLPACGAREEKPAKGPPFWTAAATLDWLADGSSAPRVNVSDDLGFSFFPRQRRVHLEIESETQAAKKGMLFSTEGLEFPDRVREANGEGSREFDPHIWSRVRFADGESWPEIEAVAPIGGERRLAYWSKTELALPAAPDYLEKKTLVRLQLVTPGYFMDGWIPKWMREGKHPAIDGVGFSLVSAVVPRAAALSGWDLEQRRPKGTRFLVPAGSVYFCEVSGDSRKLWMRSICDEEQDCRDGFGIVLCGVWEWRRD